jgi:hypothetical protein
MAKPAHPLCAAAQIALVALSVRLRPRCVANGTDRGRQPANTRPKPRGGRMPCASALSVWATWAASLRGAFCATAWTCRCMTSTPTWSRIVARGARDGGSADALMRNCDVVITCLPSPPPATPCCKRCCPRSPGKIWLEMSTTDEAEVRRLGGLVAARGRGGGRLPGLGRLSPRRYRQYQHLRRLRPRHVRACSAAADDHGAARILHTGDLGSASILKVITNYLATANLVSCAEALTVARRRGHGSGPPPMRRSGSRRARPSCMKPKAR